MKSFTFGLCTVCNRSINVPNAECSNINHPKGNAADVNQPTTLDLARQQAVAKVAEIPFLEPFTHVKKDVEHAITIAYMDGYIAALKAAAEHNR